MVAPAVRICASARARHSITQLKTDLEMATKLLQDEHRQREKELKDDKRAAMRVHGRTGQECPECGVVVREVSFADTSLQYCATCQTGGNPLADRRMSRLLK